MTTKDTALRLALEALEKAENDAAYFQTVNGDQVDAAITACREALAQPAGERGELVSIIEQLWDIIDDIDTYSDMAKADDALYRGLVDRRQKDRWKTGITTDGYTLNFPEAALLSSDAHPSEWVGLSDEEMNSLIKQTTGGFVGGMHYVHLARSIEARLREKNAGKPAAEDKAGGDEPVAYVDHADGAVIWKGNRLPGGTLLYARPQPQGEKE